MYPFVDCLLYFGVAYIVKVSHYFFLRRVPRLLPLLCVLLRVVLRTIRAIVYISVVANIVNITLASVDLGVIVSDIIVLIPYPQPHCVGGNQQDNQNNNDNIYETKTISISFMGFMPYNDPKYTFIIISPNISSNNKKSGYYVPINRYIINDLTKILFENI